MKTRFLRYLCMGLLTAALLLTAGTARAEKHPGLITITSGRSVGDGSYINHSSSGYPFLMAFTLDEDTMPEESCRIGIYSYDCDWTATGATHEYDIVQVNGQFVGILTGEDSTWNTAYMDVPLSILIKGENTITVYVGHVDNDTGEIVQNSSEWLLTIKWASVQLDGGKSQNAPDEFNIKLQYANRTEHGISCGAHATVKSETAHSYMVEYSLVDKTGNPGTTGQIVSSDRESVYGANIESTGHFFLSANAPEGDYQIQATLRDMFTNEVYAYDSMTFNLADVLKDDCEHEPVGSPEFRKKIYHMLKKDDENYSVMHQTIDMYTFTCAKCGKVVEEYRNQKLESHDTSKIPCVCGYIPEGYNPFHGLLFSAVDLCEPLRDFTVTVTCDDLVDSIYAENDIGFPMKDAWSKTDNGDGTVTFTRTYTAGENEARGRYWTVTAYSDTHSKIGTGNTNALDILEPNHVHKFTIIEREIEHKPLPDSHQDHYIYHYLYSQQEKRTCEKCKETIVEETKYWTPDDPDVVLEIHEFVNNRCTICGYLNDEGKYFTKLIQMINRGQNPMQDDQGEDSFVSLLRKRLINSGFTEEKRNKIINVLIDAPELYRNIFLLSLYNYEIFAWGNPNVPMYSSTYNSVFMKDSLKEKDFEHTFFHESGHAAQLSIKSSDSSVPRNTNDYYTQLELEIQDKLRSDVRKNITDRLEKASKGQLTEEQKQQIADALICGEQEVEVQMEREGLFGPKTYTDTVPPSIQNDAALRGYYIYVRDELKNDLIFADDILFNPNTQASMRADIYGGFTNNKINTGGGHYDDGYWYKMENHEDGSTTYTNNETYAQLKEAWAEFYSAKIRNDTYNIQKNAEYFPEATLYLQNLANDIFSVYWNYYTDLYQ